MAETNYTLWCYVEGDKNLFPVIPPSTTSMGMLKELIKEKRSNFLQGVDAADLTLFKVGYIMISV